jgi:hypothetical protein
MGYDMYIEERKTLTKDKEYFRLNISGMPLFRHVMKRLDMLDWDVVAGPWPADTLNDTEYADEAALVTDANHSTKGISAYKLCSNDGWLVTPEELHNALEAYQSHADSRAAVVRQVLYLEFDNPEDRKWMSNYWRQWIAFLKRAEKHGGFRVY